MLMEDFPTVNWDLFSSHPVKFQFEYTPNRRNSRSAHKSAPRLGSILPVLRNAPSLLPLAYRVERDVSRDRVDPEEERVVPNALRRSRCEPAHGGQYAHLEQHRCDLEPLPQKSGCADEWVFSAASKPWPSGHQGVEFVVVTA